MVRRLQKYTFHPLYLPMLSFLIAADLFLLVVPSDGLVVVSTLARPKRWLRIALWVTTGSAFGAILLAFLVQTGAGGWVQGLVDRTISAGAWEKSTAFLQTHGLWALALIALSPLPQQPSVVIAGLGQMPLLEIFAAVWLGRGVKYGFYCWAASHAPKLLMRVSVLRHEIQKIQGLEENTPSGR